MAAEDQNPVAAVGAPDSHPRHHSRVEAEAEEGVQSPGRAVESRVEEQNRRHRSPAEGRRRRGARGEAVRSRRRQNRAVRSWVGAEEEVALRNHRPAVHNPDRAARSPGRAVRNPGVAAGAEHHTRAAAHHNRARSAKRRWRRTCR